MMPLGSDCLFDSETFWQVSNSYFTDLIEALKLLSSVCLEAGRSVVFHIVLVH